jgi:Mg/Co/Ni transporter MgtE
VTTAARVFIARLPGIGVFDPNGDLLGRMREAVTTLRVDHQPPRVLGLVVELPGRLRIFVPMGRVTRIEPDAIVLSSGTVNMKRFETRANEVLVLAGILDRTVTVREDNQRVTVVDVAMDQTRTRDWVIAKLAVRAGAGRLTRRRGQLFQVAWDEVDGLTLSDSDMAEQGTDTMLSMLEGMRAADVATALQEMPDKRRLEVAAALDDERLADVLQELPEDDQVDLLSSLADERAADVLEAMDDDDAADLLGEMPADEQERLLKLMQPDEAAPLRRLLTYGDYTAGGLMTSEPVVLLPDATVAEALALIRNPDLTPALAAQVFVVRPPQATPTGRFLGTAHVQRLLREPPSALVSGIVENDPRPLDTHTSITDITKHLATYNLVAAPVLDDTGSGWTGQGWTSRSRPDADFRFSTIRKLSGGGPSGSRAFSAPVDTSSIKRSPRSYGSCSTCFRAFRTSTRTRSPSSPWSFRCRLRTPRR